MIRGGKYRPKTYERIAVTTGTTSSIGQATMQKYTAAGFDVVGNGRNAEKLAALEGEIGPAFYGVAGNAADIAVVDRLFAKIDEHFGRPAGIVVANAGRGLGGSVKGADLSQLEDVFKRLNQNEHEKGMPILPQRWGITKQKGGI